MEFKIKAIKQSISISLLMISTMSVASGIYHDKNSLVNHINEHYSYQLTNPQKKNRRSFAQFGYGLYFLPIPIYQIAEFINPHDFGPQSYSVPSKKEHNGVLYTCRGGFIDFSHMRAALDWSVHLIFKILTEGESGLELPPEAATLKIQFKELDRLTINDIADIGQKIAYERLAWHEAASWHYHIPNHLTTEQVSAFTPEDLYSNFLGTLIGKRVALRILSKLETKSYSEIATEEIQKMIDSLRPVSTEKDSMDAYDIVDRAKQMKRPLAERNKDIWYDSSMLMSDFRYIFKRNIVLGPELEPWTVPQLAQCEGTTDLEILKVPQVTESGTSFYEHYEFSISPSRELFYSKFSKRQLHPTFSTFSTKNFDGVIQHIKKQMEQGLLPGFDTRDMNDPIPKFKNKKKRWF